MNVEHFVLDHPQLAADILAFDVWIHNTDRRDENLAYSRVGRIPVAVFDHEQALFHTFPQRGKIHLDSHKTSSIEHHVFSDRIADGNALTIAVERVRAVPQHAIRHTLDNLTRDRAITDPEAKSAEDFLRARANSLDQLLTVLVHPKQPALP